MNLKYDRALRKRYPYSELFWSAFPRIRTEYGETWSISPYSVRMRENADQNNSEYGHFLRSGEDAITIIHCIKYQNFTLFPGNAEMRSFCIVSSNPHEAGNARFCKISIPEN